MSAARPTAARLRPSKQYVRADRRGPSPLRMPTAGNCPAQKGVNGTNAGPRAPGRSVFFLAPPLLRGRPDVVVRRGLPEPARVGIAGLGERGQFVPGPGSLS